MKSLLGSIFVLTLLLFPTAYTQQRQLVLEDSRSAKRVALVIGNGAYVNAPPLKNPVNDAHDIAQSLREFGFDVIYRENLNQNDMKRAIREFGAKIRNGGVGLFYYAGHGVAVKGANYLIPVDAKVENEEEIEYECVDAGFVLAQMESAANRLNIVILDSCRNNPFARSFRSASRGLAQMDAPSGTLIAYSTAPGSVASDGNSRNGLYTQEFLKFMRTSNLGIEEVFKQVRISVRNLTQGKQTPWESSSLVGDFSFAGARNVGGPPPASRPAPTVGQSNQPSATYLEGKSRLATQESNLTRYLYLYSRFCRDFEDDERAGRKEQVEKNRATIKDTLGNWRAGISALELFFRQSPDLQAAYLRLEGATELAGTAERQFSPSDCDKAGRTLLEVQRKLADALQNMSAQ